MRTALVDETALVAWGRSVGRAILGGSISLPLTVTLRGPLGAGKSVLARAIAAGAGVATSMPSPTYNLLFSYEVEGLTVNHLDLYRLEHPDDIWELGWRELGEGDQLVLVEWPERAEELLPPDRWEVRLAFPGEGGDDGVRRIEVERIGSAPAPVPLPRASDQEPA